MVSNFFNAILVAFIGESFRSVNKARDTAFCTSTTGWTTSSNKFSKSPLIFISNFDDSHN